MKSILDKSFKYVPASQQDCAATFKRIRKEMADAAKAAQVIRHEKILKVRNIK